jgi:hypothetical protein
MRCVVKNPNERAVVNVVDEVAFLIAIFGLSDLGRRFSLLCLSFQDITAKSPPRNSTPNSATPSRFLIFWTLKVLIKERMFKGIQVSAILRDLDMSYYTKGDVGQNAGSIRDLMQPNTLLVGWYW